MASNKFLSLLMSILIIFFLVACNPVEELDVDALLLDAEQTVELEETVTSNLTLPTTVVSDALTVIVTWSSNNTAVITNTGIVTRPLATTGNVLVTLTATFTYLEKTKIKVFDITVEALASVTVNFESNGGSAVLDISTSQGLPITEPAIPTKTESSFGGWYKEDTLLNQWIFTTDIVNENMTLYAKWVDHGPFDVTFYMNNGEPDVIVSVVSGQKLTPIEEPTVPGFSFSHWSKMDFTPWDFDLDVVTEDMTLYAFYNLISYSITYIIPEGAEITNPGTASYDVFAPVENLGSAYLANHEFLGWFTALTGGIQVTSISIGTYGDLTLYAQFEED